MQPLSATIRPIHVGDLRGVGMPIFVHLIEHPGGTILVDTGMTETHPAVADMDPQLHPLTEQHINLDRIDLIVNTHLHFDHCGGNHLFPSTPIYVQRRELDDARTLDDYTLPDWVDPPNTPLNYVAVDGELELLPGVRLVPTPGHTAGSQVVVVQTGAGTVIIAGDTAVSFAEIDEPKTEGQRVVRELNPEIVWISHSEEPWRPVR
jgi:N-acyl homoserine lactone hydrolase